MEVDKQSAKPLVGIGIPVYNGEKYIAEAIESVIRQTYSNWECHIVNNVSSDRTAEIVQKYADTDSRIILHSCDEFFPLVDNWNRTVTHIPDKAVYFKLLQADDWIDATYLEEMITLMEQHHTIGICSSYRIDGTVVNCDGLDYYQGQFHNGTDLLIRHLKEEIDLTGSVTTLLFRVTTLKKLPQFPEIFDPGNLHCDTQLAFDMMYESDLGFVFKVLSYTRWHPEADTSKTCVVFNTFLNGREFRLFKYRGIHPDIEKEYILHRYTYAYFLIKRWILGDKKCLQWHSGHLPRKFTTKEYLMALWYFNPFNYRLFKLFRKSLPKN